ncbi:MAG: hypothetical protein HC929_04580 [Leptolyngbyaceae cyanobacterium SM2_5_2]|nr:hypothetical protein [Leptolyngbyaceae cyanobacterium SM2_5_2]
MQQIFPAIAGEHIPDLIHQLSSSSGEIALAPSLLLLGNPEFLSRPDGTLDLAFDFKGQRLVFPEVNRHFDALYSPAYMTRIALPREPGPEYAIALNRVIGRSQALYGGYLSPDMTLPEPLQRLEN